MQDLCITLRLLLVGEHGKGVSKNLGKNLKKVIALYIREIKVVTFEVEILETASYRNVAAVTKITYLAIGDGGSNTPDFGTLGNVKYSASQGFSIVTIRLFPADSRFYMLRYGNPDPFRFDFLAMPCRRRSLGGRWSHSLVYLCFLYYDENVWPMKSDCWHGIC